MIYTLKHEHEPEIKQKLNTLIEERAFSKDPELLAKATKFINSNYAYFGTSSFFENELQTLHSLSNESWNAISNFMFAKFKAILEKQLII
jgi:hypothetical protein